MRIPLSLRGAVLICTVLLSVFFWAGLYLLLGKIR